MMQYQYRNIIYLILVASFEDICSRFLVIALVRKKKLLRVLKFVVMIF